jgi:NADH-quinone oxidoreductase subunit E
LTALSAGFYDRAREIIARYPVSRSALLMLLHEAQDEIGYISDEAIREIGGLLDLSSADVAGVVTFYTMFKRKHPGRFLISVCDQSACQFFGADDTLDKLREVVGPEHEATDDGLMSWEHVECLAFCGAAPAAQLNYMDVPNLTAERAERLIRALRDGRDLDDVLADLRADAKLPELAELSAGVPGDQDSADEASTNGAGADA